ncbi:MAG TPA: lipid II flippase Amj family protein [Bacilli bacterium]
MPEKIVLVFLCTLIIHAVDTLSYAVRLAGVRTGKLAVSLSLTGMIVLVSRTSNMIQAPFAGKIIDMARKSANFDPEFVFRIIIAASSFGTILAILLFPTIVNISAKAIDRLEVAGSIPQLLRASVQIDKLKRVRGFFVPPKWEMLSRMRLGGVPKRLMLLNCVVTAVYTIGVLSALYASYLVPELGTATSQSSGLINGFATVILIVLIDPQVALLTDRTIRGESRKSELNKMFATLMLSRFVGTLLAQLIFVPAALWVIWLVRLL